MDETVEELQAKIAEMEDVHGKKVKSLSDEASKYRKTASERATALQKFDGFDIDVLTKLQSEAATREEDKLKEAGRFEELKGNLLKEHSLQLEASQKQGQGWQEKYKTVVIDKALIAAAAKYKAWAPDEVATLTKSRVRLDEETGSPIVLDDNDSPRLDKEGNRMTIDSFISSWLQDRPNHVQASPGGAGSKNGGDGSGGGKGTIAEDQIGLNLEKVAKGELKVA